MTALYHASSGLPMSCSVAWVVSRAITWHSFPSSSGSQMVFSVSDLLFSMYRARSRTSLCAPMAIFVRLYGHAMYSGLAGSIGNGSIFSLPSSSSPELLSSGAVEMTLLVWDSRRVGGAFVRVDFSLAVAAAALYCSLLRVD